MSFTPDELSLIHDVSLIQRRRQHFYTDRNLQVVYASELSGSVERGIEIARELTRQDSIEDPTLHKTAIEGRLLDWTARVDENDLNSAIAERIQFILTAKPSMLIDDPVDRSVFIDELDRLCEPILGNLSISLVFVTD